MAREIRLDAIADEKFYKDVVKVVSSATLLWEELTVRATPEVSGNLKRSWNSDIKPFLGVVSTNVEYAEPVAFGTNLPPSWQGQYRTRQQTIKGYPELISKQIQARIQDKFGR